MCVRHEVAAVAEAADQRSTDARPHDQREVGDDPRRELRDDEVVGCGRAQHVLPDDLAPLDGQPLGADRRQPDRGVAGNRRAVRLTTGDHDVERDPALTEMLVQAREERLTVMRYPALDEGDRAAHTGSSGRVGRRALRNSSWRTGRPKPRLEREQLSARGQRPHLGAVEIDRDAGARPVRDRRDDIAHDFEVDRVEALHRRALIVAGLERDLGRAEQLPVVELGVHPVHRHADRLLLVVDLPERRRPAAVVGDPAVVQVHHPEARDRERTLRDHAIADRDAEVGVQRAERVAGLGAVDAGHLDDREAEPLAELAERVLIGLARRRIGSRAQLQPDAPEHVANPAVPPPCLQATQLAPAIGRRAGVDDRADDRNALERASEVVTDARRVAARVARHDRDTQGAHPGRSAIRRLSRRILYV